MRLEGSPDLGNTMSWHRGCMRDRSFLRAGAGQPFVPLGALTGGQFSSLAFPERVWAVPG